ncbi:MAG TPA: TolC family protein [Aquabacterium sp.]|nr:TolC family protein [Aquabacterium sp.]
MVRHPPHALAASLALTLAAWHLPAAAQTAAPAAAPQRVAQTFRQSAANLGDAVGALVPTWLQPAAPAVLPDAAPPPPADQAETLGDLLARMLPREPQVRTALALRRAAEERRQQARSRLGPTLYVQSSYGQGRETEILRADPFTRTTDRTEAGLRWNLYNAGNDRAELAGAERDVAAAEQDLRRAREDTAERIAETYVELLHLQAQLTPAAERLTAVRKLAEQVRQQADAGKASPADLTQAEASLLDADVAYEQLVADHASARAKLAALVGGEVRKVAPVVLAPVAPGQAKLGSPGLVEAAQLRAVAARERVRPPVSLLAPRIDLEVRQRLSDRTNPVLTTEQKSNWQLVARWDFPVLGESVARRNEGMRRAEAAEAEAERVARTVQSDLDALDARIEIAIRALASLDRQLQQYDQLVRAGELQFDAGRRSLQQLIGLRDSRYAIAQRRADQEHRLLASRLRQLALTGKLLVALGLGS